VIVYREQKRLVRTRDAIAVAEAASGFERLMAWGEIEAALADALCPERDDDLAIQPRHCDAFAEIEISVPEGFAYYALDPELYRIAARRFLEDARPARVAVIGIRSIGTTLAAVVESELRARGVAAESWTVRPRGHPWNRELRITDRLARRWREWPGWFAIVDEGPGLSGSSFASVAECLSGLGVPDERIVFLPSWQTDGSGFVSETARRRWQRHRRYTADFEELGLFPGARELSAGRWREMCGTWPAVQPQHERRKYLCGDRLFKFAGYGRYGREKLERAHRLSAFTTPALGFENGFLEMRWVPGRPARLCPGLIQRAAEYLAFLRREFRTGEPADTGPLAEMIACNTGEPWPGPLPEEEAVVLDGRMLPHEWIETADGFHKTDALDHHDDHFFPGPHDIAWDVAAFAAETSAGEAFVEHYRSQSGDHEIAARLPFYRAAYLAFRLGYADLAVRALAGTEEAARFDRERARYCRALDARGNGECPTTRSRLSA
jgi:hypothetical protein